VKRISERQIITVIILLLPLAWFFPAETGKLALVHGDGWPQHIGMRFQVGQMIARGMLPLWNPYVFGGMPLLAASYPGALYPLNWVFAFLPPGAAMNVVVIATFHLALVGAYRFARAVGCNRLGALITGVVFTFGGFMVMSQGNTAKVTAAAWLPWVLLAIEKLYQTASWRRVTLGALFIALQCWAGFPQMSFYTALVGGAYFLFSVTMREQRQPRLRLIAATGVMALCGALISLIHLLPLRELQGQGARNGITYENFSSHDFPLRQAPALVFPYLFGGAALPPYHLPYHGEWGIYVTAGYVGMLAMMLALVAMVGWRGRLVWFWAFVAVVALLLAFGASLPFGLNRLLYRVPVYNLFRTASRHLVEFDFALAVLAGLGVSFLERAEGSEARRAVKWSLVIMAVIVIGTATAYGFSSRGLLLRAEVLVPVSFFILSAAVLWIYARRRAPLFGWLLVVVLVCDLASFGQFLDWRTLYFSVADHIADPVTVKFIKAREPDLNAFRILSHAANPFDYNYELLNYPSLSITRRLQSVNGYDELRLLRPAGVMGGMSIDGIVRDERALSAAHRGFDLLNVRYLLHKRTGEVPAPERWRKLASFYEVDVYENLKVLPRAWLVPAVLAVPEADMPRVISEGKFSDGKSFDPSAQALVDPTLLRGGSFFLPQPEITGQASVISYAPQQIILNTSAPKDRFLVLSEIDYPGWEAQVDGRQTEVYRTDYTLRGVVVPAGEHRVEFVYRPQSFRRGLIAAGIGALILIAGSASVWLTGRKRAAESPR